MVGNCEELLARIARAGMDVCALATQLQAEGAASFIHCWNKLMAVIDSKSVTLKRAT
jgi:transaldolase